MRPPCKDHDAVGDLQRGSRVLLDDEDRDALALQPTDHASSRPARSSARGPGSARRTAPARASRAARARWPPSAFRRPRGSRTRASSGVRAPRRCPYLRDAPGAEPWSCMPSARFRATVSVGKTRRSSGTQPMPAGDLCVATGNASALEVDMAAARRVSPRMERSVVVLPAPLAPSSATTSPAPTDSDGPNSACVSP